MNLKIVRRIRGNVHGSIDVSELEDAVISHPYFQRLRRVKQLAFLSYVFPGATHTRFEHSLGVMHLVGVAWDKLRVNQERLGDALGRYGDYQRIEHEGTGEGIVHGLLAPTFPMAQQVFSSSYVLQAIRLAGLLHDLGHPPFSHSGERFLPTWVEVARANQDAPDYLRDYFARQIDALRAAGRDPSRITVRHEVFSMLMVERVLRDVYREHPNLTLKVEPRDVIAIITPGILPEPDSELVTRHAYELCHELISGELDLDRMDYLLRDSRECGVVYGIFDAGRILDSLCVYFDPLDEKLHVAISLSGLAAFEDYLRARHSMYLQLYFHKSSVAAEAMMQYLGSQLEGWRLPAHPEAYAECDEYNIGSMLLAEAETRLSRAERQHFAGLVRDLLFHRRLWKRVYEVTGSDKRSSPEKEIAIVRSYLDEQGFRYEQVSSGTSLTRFRPRGENQPSRNYLRLVKKDETQFPRVCAIEDFSEVIAANDRTFIHRIYVEPGLDQNGEPIPSRVKRELPSRFNRAPRP